jgi:alpha-beta hydrolase superfamily lysophospholipase
MPVAELGLRVPAVIDRVPIVMRLTADMGAVANDPQIASAIAKDPHSGGTWMPGRWLRTFLTSSPVVPPEEFDVCPVVLAHPGADRWTDIELSLPFFDRIAKVDKRLVVLENAGHLPVEEPGRTQLADTVLGELERARSQA